MKEPSFIRPTNIYSFFNFGLTIIVGRRNFERIKTCEVNKQSNLNFIPPRRTKKTTTIKLITTMTGGVSKRAQHRSKGIPSQQNKLLAGIPTIFGALPWLSSEVPENDTSRDTGFPRREEATHVSRGPHVRTRKDSKGDFHADVDDYVKVSPAIPKAPDFGSSDSPDRAEVKAATSRDTPSPTPAGSASESGRRVAPPQPKQAVEPVWLWNAHAKPDVGKLWLEFDPQTAGKLEAEFQKNDHTANFELNIMGKAYQFNFSTMEQVNKATKFMRQIYRKCVPKKPVSADGHPEPRLNRLFPSGYMERVVYDVVEEVNWRVVTKFVRVYADRGDYKRDTLDPIMMEPLGPGDDENPVVKLSCGCIFPQSSIEKALSSNPKCPKCSNVFLAPGAQPSGTMEIREKNFSCEGAEGCATIEIRYNFKGGIQNDRMQRPGEPFSGTSRIVFVPSDGNGAETLALLKSAFRHGHSFMVGDSVTTGKRNTTVWRIHQKTSTSGGAARFGWPDAGYLNRLQSECVNYGLVDLEDTV